MSALATDGIARLDELAERRGLSLDRDVRLAPMTTLRVGGPADRFATATTIDELVALAEAATEAGVPLFLLGKGSDLVVADEGIRGLVVRVRADDVRIDGTTLRAEAGASMTGLAKTCQRLGLAGFDWAISIPGSFGGAVWANAGAHGGEMRDVLVSIETWDPRSGRRAIVEPSDAGFAYRDSRFKHGAEVVLAGTIGLRAGDPRAIGDAMAAHGERRRATQPLADQNAGSVFRNPAGDHAGRLVEAAGLKGHRIGTAQVSTLHANFIVTDRGSGRARDVRTLGDHVRATVADRFGIELAYEIAFVGAWDEEATR